MNPPNSIVGQVNRSMNAGVPALDQMTSSNPGFNPGNMPPPNTPMPNKSPMSAIHRALARRGINPANIPQLQSPQIPANGVGQGGGVVPQPQMGTPAAGSGGVAQASSAPTPSMPVSETELILKALSKHLDHRGKIEERLLNAMIPEPNGIQQ
jgi:hypothetical protein